MKFYETAFGNANFDEILKQKSSSKQIRAIAGGKDNDEPKISEEECRAYCRATNNLEYLDGYESRVRQYTITDESVDRYGDIVRAAGVSLANYLKNPVIQFAHDYAQPPVGFSIRTWLDKATNTIKALALFLDDRVDTTGRSDLIFRLVKTNGMRACSIGFDPIETYHPKNENERAKLGLGEYGVEYRSSDLLEFSPVPLPANPNALTDSYRRAYNDSFSKSLRSGLFTAADVGVLKKYPLFDDSILDIFVRELGIKSVVTTEPEPQAEPQQEQPEAPAEPAAAVVPEQPIETKSAPIYISLDVGAIIKEIQSIKEAAESTATLLKSVQESFDATSKKFDATTQKTLSAVEMLTRRASFYDNQKDETEKDLRGILGLKK